jgi:hypothetical protein
MSLEYYAGGDSATFKVSTFDLDGNLVSVDSAAIIIRKCNTTAERDWVNGASVLVSTGMTNFGTGIYRYNWSTTSLHAGRYVAEVTVVRGGVTNAERIVVVLT